MKLLRCNEVNGRIEVDYDMDVLDQKNYQEHTKQMIKEL